LSVSAIAAVVAERARIDKHDQALDLSRRPLSAANSDHLAQSGVPGLFPK
jgi:hypothetical protein